MVSVAAAGPVALFTRISICWMRGSGERPVARTHSHDRPPLISCPLC